LMPDQVAGQYFDQVPVLFNQIARPPPQSVADPYRAASTVWRFAQGQHLAQARGLPQIALHARWKFDGAGWLRRDTRTAVPGEEARPPNPDVLIHNDRQPPHAISAGPLCNGVPGFVKRPQFFRRSPSPPAGRRLRCHAAAPAVNVGSPAT
jgi:hypothetical protein